MKVNANIDMTEIMEMLSVPEIERNMYFAVENYKTGEYAQKIKLFKAKKKAMKQALFGSYPGENENIPNGLANRLYWFELGRFRRNQWEINILEPTPPPYYKESEIMPEDLVQMITNNPVDPDRVERMTGVRSQLYGRNYDLQFTLFSRYFACGTIRENQKAQEQRFKSQVFTWNEQWDVAYKVLFHYMERFPSLRNYLFKEFFNILKPAVDEKNIEEPSISK
jgi:hypothetical protein